MCTEKSIKIVLDSSSRIAGTKAAAEFILPNYVGSEPRSGNAYYVVERFHVASTTSDNYESIVMRIPAINQPDSYDSILKQETNVVAALANPQVPGVYKTSTEAMMPILGTSVLGQRITVHLSYLGAAAYEPLERDWFAVISVRYLKE